MIALVMMSHVVLPLALLFSRARGPAGSIPRVA